MEKKGFTLVELLAVIVVLAVISIITIPMILGVIETAKKGAAESSVLGYIDAVEKQIMMNQLDSTKTNIVDRTYSVEELTELGVTIKGTVPTGNVTIENSQVSNYILGVNGYVVENGTTTKVNNTQKYNNGYAVYYDPTTGESCEASNAVSTTETKTGCMKWYVYNDSNGNATINMILDHNTTARLAWNTAGTNVSYEESNIKPEADKLVSESNWEAIPRLITAYEVATIVEKTGFTNASSWFYLDSKDLSGPASGKGGSKYAWLFDRTKSDCEIYGCANNENPSMGTWGYWISTTYGKSGSVPSVWVVFEKCSLSINGAYDPGIGVRPVITISKSKVS